MDRQIVLVLTLNPVNHPEACAVPIEEFASNLVESLDINFELLGEEEYIPDRFLTHLIIRDMDGEDEKAILALKLLPSRDTVDAEDIEEVA